MPSVRAAPANGQGLVYDTASGLFVPADLVTKAQRDADLAMIETVYRFTNYVGNQNALTYLCPPFGQVIHPNTNLSTYCAWKFSPRPAPAGKKAQIRIRAVGGHNNGAPTGDAQLRLGLGEVEPANSSNLLLAFVAGGFATGGGSGSNGSTNNVVLVANSKTYAFDGAWIDAPTTEKSLAVTATLGPGTLSAASYAYFWGAIERKFVDV